MLRRISGIIIVLAACVSMAGLLYSTQACEARRDTSAQGSAPQNPTPAASQNPTPGEPQKQKVLCTLHRDQSPHIGGVRLGLTVDELLALFPGSKEDAELRPAITRAPSPLGVSTFLIKPDRYASKAKFEGIRDIAFNLLDGRVSGFTANYLAGDWNHVDEFVNKFTAGSNLPGADSWDAYVGLDTQQKSLKCDGFEVTLFAGGKNVNANHVKVQDLAAAQQLKERRAKAKQKAQTAP